MGTHPIFESDFDCLTEWLKARKVKSQNKTKMQSGTHLKPRRPLKQQNQNLLPNRKKVGNLSKFQDRAILTLYSGKGKKSKAAAFMADLEEELKDEDLVNKMASVSVEEGLSKSQLKKQKREQKKKAKGGFAALDSYEDQEA